MKRTTIILNENNLEKLVNVLGDSMREVSYGKWVAPGLVVEYEDGKIRVCEISKGNKYSPSPGTYLDAPKGKGEVETFEALKSFCDDRG